MPLFTTAFAPPPTLEGLTASGESGAAVELGWDPTTLAPVDFVAYYVRRSLTGLEGSYETLATITDAGTPSFTDYGAPLDRPLYYRVTQANLDLESLPAEVTTALEGCAWWLVTPGAPGGSFELPRVTTYDSEWPLQSVSHEPIGRSRKLVETGLLLGEEGSLTSVLYPEDDPGVLELIRAAASGVATEVLLKTPYGEVFAVVLGSISRKRQTGGIQEVSLSFTEV